MSDSLIPSFLRIDVSESLRLLTKNERCEQIAQVAHQKWATMSDSLRSLTKNKRIPSPGWRETNIPLKKIWLLSSNTFSIQKNQMVEYTYSFFINQFVEYSSYIYSFLTIISWLNSVTYSFPTHLLVE